MSAETQQWLDDNTLIGNTDLRGNAWHWRAGTDNHFPGVVPLDRVVSLFDWKAVSTPLTGMIPATPDEADTMDEHGAPMRTVTAPNRQGLFRSDTGAFMGIHSEGYTVHDHNEWLLSRFAAMPIGSAGLLRGGAVAWVQVDNGDALVSNDGVEILPFITGCTSLDGTLATHYFNGYTRTVCDNTLSAATQAAVTKFTLKHTKHSAAKILGVNEALGIMAEEGKAALDEINRQNALKVTGRQFESFLDLAVPVSREAGRGQTMALNKRDVLTALYAGDERVAPWRGTYFGVLQLMNTWLLHASTVRGDVHRAERNMLSTIDGSVAKQDEAWAKMLDSVLV